MHQTKITKFTEIFKLLDSDEDNEISKHRIATTELPADIIDYLSPIFNELDQLDEGIDLNEFVDAAMRLYDVSFHFFKIF